MFDKLKGVGIALALGLTLALGGCTPKDLVIHDPTTLVTPAQKAQAAIDQAYATHASITVTLAQNYHDGVITKGEKDAYAVRTRSALNDLDSADDFLSVGNIADSAGRLALANKVFTLIQQELALQAAKGK